MCICSSAFVPCISDLSPGSPALVVQEALSSGLGFSTFADEDLCFVLGFRVWGLGFRALKGFAWGFKGSGLSALKGRTVGVARSP